MKLKKHFYYLILCFICINNVYSQNRTWITYEVGQSRNQNEWNSNGSNLEIRKGHEGIVGLYIEQEVNKYLSIEIGVNDKFYGFDAKINEVDTIKLSSYAQYVQIPLRLKGKFNLFKERVYLSSFVGVGFTFNSYNGVKIYPNGYDYLIQSNFPKNIYILQSGLNLEVMLKSWRFGCLVTYNNNPKDFIKYSVDALETSFKSTGDYMTYQLRVGYAISNIWKKR